MYQSYTVSFFTFMYYRQLQGYKRSRVPTFLFRIVLVVLDCLILFSPQLALWYYHILPYGIVVEGKILEKQGIKGNIPVFMNVMYIYLFSLTFWTHVGQAGDLNIPWSTLLTNLVFYLIVFIGFI